MDLVGGIPTPPKNMKVNWDDDSQLNGKMKHVPNHQPDMYTNIYSYLI